MPFDARAVAATEGRARRAAAEAAAGRARFEEAAVALLPNFAPPEAAEALVRHCRALLPKCRAEKGSYAVNRLGYRLDGAALKAALEALGSDEATARVSALVGERVAVEDAAVFPVDLRVYRKGSSMGWHTDELLYNLPHYEMVWTAWNTSDRGKGVGGGATASNDAIVLRSGPDGADHCVTECSHGERAIIKLVFRPDHAARMPCFYSLADLQTSGNKASHSARQLEAIAEGKQQERRGRARGGGRTRR